MFCYIILTFCLIVATIGKDAVAPQPKINEYSENVRISAAYPESKVTITVGDKFGFNYTVTGITRSDKKIAVSGEYYDEPDNHYGYARLYLVVDTGVDYYSIRPNRNVLDVYIENANYDEFYFSVYCPYPVSAYNLNQGQINATAVLITGPSRSVVYSRK